MVTHDMSLAERCATRVVRLIDGRVAEDTFTGASR
jgi:predicted ABC-type transport system involved in lysophospholipase L1 biosynthesis ATPase subunit